MKNRFIQMIAFLLLAAGLAFPAAASAESEQETFLRNFEAVYPADIGEVIDSANPYAKSVGIVKTTKNGISVLLDKVLVTEDELAVSFLISGDFPENLFDVQLSASIEAGPLLPYPPDSFELARHGGGGGGPRLRLLTEVNEDLPVALDTASVFLMRHDGYISPSDPMQVHIRVPQITVGWEYTDADGIVRGDQYYEDEVLEFDFVTDGAELAAQTKTFELNHAFEIDGKTYEFHTLRFNPMQLILFTGEVWTHNGPPYATGIRYVEAITTEGTKIELAPTDSDYHAYYGFTKKILDPAVIQSLETTKTLTLTPCYLPLPADKERDTYINPQPGDPAYDCNPENAVTVTIRD